MDIYAFTGCKKRLAGDIVSWDNTTWIFETGFRSQMEVKYYQIIILSPQSHCNTLRKIYELKNANLRSFQYGHFIIEKIKLRNGKKKPF